ncbi:MULTISPECIES: arylsulfatase [unclassified Rhizobium]|uniref:arylsulfatase B n=1 Tax=unclassified Rhizobium TaxID=2613769 RepID=UPI001FCD5665|nr:MULTISPECIES: arylsulfatase [unclassified Rhizobium]
MTRRDALLSGAAVLASRLTPPIAALGGIMGSTVVSAQPAQPNIIYIVADDLGWSDTGYRGSDIKTPHLDKLAEGGARLDQFYALPMCTPTRAAFVTGRYPLRYGLQTGVIPAAGTYGIPLDEYLLPQVLKDAGYETALVGKWHLGHAKPEYWPRQRGFDHFYGALVGEIDHFKHSSHGVKDWYRNNKPLEEDGFDNSLFGDEAVRTIERRDKGKPLFMYLAFTAPHTPFQAPQDYLDRFKHIEDENRRTYAAMISVMDDGIGRVVAALDENGMRENTIIVFHSDNGGVRSSLFAGDSKVGGSLPANNGVYRDGKGTLYEGGTRVGAIANWPGKIRPGTVDALIHVVDMLPTLAALAGASTAKAKALDGVDVWPAISEGKASGREEVIYNVDPLAGAIRRGDWKLVWKASLPQKLELFNLANDPSETKNLAEQHPDNVRELQGRITELASEMAPPQLIMEAVRLTFYVPPVTPDPSVLFGLGD